MGGGPQEEEKEKSGDNSSGESLDTKSTSKHSKSRAEKDRGPKRKAAKLAKVKEHYAKLGKPWVDDPQKHRQLAAELATGMKGSVASGSHTQAIEAKREIEAQPTSIEDALITESEIPLDMTKWIRMVDGQPRCMICQKWWEVCSWPESMFFSFASLALGPSTGPYMAAPQSTFIS